MKRLLVVLAVLGLAASTLAQETAVQEQDAAEARDPVVTGQAVTEDPLGRPVAVTSHQSEPSPHDYRAEFDAMDSNADGRLSHSEAGADKYLARTFASYDSDHDEALSFEEARNWLED